MKNFKIKVAGTLSIFLISAAAAQAHARLDHTVPAAGSTVSSSPSQVTLIFTENLEPKFSGGDVVSLSGTRMDHGSSVSGSTMRIDVPGLPPGGYVVHWHALSVDTHKSQGSFSFHVAK
jgi:copper resistance protein C